MNRLRFLKAVLAGGVCTVSTVGVAFAANIDVPGGDLESALSTYSAQTGVPVLVQSDAIKGVRTGGARGDLSESDALTRILKGTGFAASRGASGVVQIIRQHSSQNALQSPAVQSILLAQATPSTRTAVETVTVTSSKLGGADVQSIPIAITALSQEQLTATQTAGGPDLVKQVPNLTFTKTNFSGYSIQIRGIGTQAISVTTDPAVAVAFNDIPFIRNHFFEQEFYDVSQVEVLRGPQGTLYGRNATAGVVNLVSAKPTDQFEAMASADIGNYHQRRFEGMINIPVVDDWLDIRIAGEWTKRQGYSFNSVTNQRIDGRDLWSGRVTIGWKPIEKLQTYLVWEHFSEDDDRLRSSKQLCKNDPGPQMLGNEDLGPISNYSTRSELSQGCLPTSLYSADAFQVPNGFSLPYLQPLYFISEIDRSTDIYANTSQSTNLRVTESTLDPTYKAKNDTVEFNADYSVTPELTLSSQTAYNHDFLWSTEDYNRFNTAPGVFVIGSTSLINANGEFCDPQLGCTSRVVAEDLSEEHAWQLSQEVRLTSHFSGPLNFSMGGNYLHYETEENYYVFLNAITLFLASYTNGGGSVDSTSCLLNSRFSSNGGAWFQYGDPNRGSNTVSCRYIDPNPIGSLNNEGHNYYLNQNPYVLNSYATFGEGYLDIFNDLKATVGLRWTEDRKHFAQMPSWLAADGYGSPVIGVIDQQWDELTGRTALNWTPKLDFTDQTLVYGSYAHGYKAGGANPPGAVLIGAGTNYSYNISVQPVHPLTFKPEFIDAFEIGTKNTLLDGAITLNGNVFYYNYENYQISEIVDRTAINLNFDAHVKGAELEGDWEPIPGLRLNFAGGWEQTALAKGAKAVDLMDRTAGHPGWVVVRPPPELASNCILPVWVAQDFGNQLQNIEAPTSGACYGYIEHKADGQLWSDGFDSNSPDADNQGAGPAPNNGAGFDKDLSGNELPNAPRFTVSAGAQYTMPISADWAGTLRSDFYWQADSWARVFNDTPYDRLKGYTNFNLALIFTSQAGWQVMLYDKNVFNTTAITGDFLNSDDSNLTTNIFLTDPKLIGIRVTKNW